MKVGVYWNGNVEKQAAEALARALERAGAACVLFAKEDEIGGVDRLIVLGGDGTLLHAAKAASLSGIPLVGINYGTIGFLTEFEREEAEQAVSLVLDETCPRLERSMIEAEVGGQISCCLNEIALVREVSEREPSRVLTISVRIGESSAGEWTADGLIVCTPTGSTAYSLSAGGCIMTPDCRALLMTPLCAFSLRSRPVALPDDSRLCVSAANGSLLVYGDGVFLGRVAPGTEVHIKKSAKSAVFLTREKNGFFRRLTEKIN